jgi:hypothetical protein
LLALEVVKKKPLRKLGLVRRFYSARGPFGNGRRSGDVNGNYFATSIIIPRGSIKATAERAGEKR